MLKNQLLRWLLLPFVAVSVFFVMAVFGAFFAGILGIWYEPVIGFFAAFFVVMATSFAAPRFAIAVALVTYLLGAIVAWFLLGISYYPESYSRAYEPTSIPLIATYIGGLVAVFFCFILNRKLAEHSN